LIALDDFVAAIQTAVVEAADQVRRRNLELLAEYFERPEDLKGWRERNGASGGGEDGPPSADEDRGTPPLVPKMVTMEFPRETKDGPVSHTVHVPLIALVPHQGLLISELRASFKLEVMFDEEKGPLIKISPRTRKVKDRIDEEFEDEVATVEIVITDEGPPKGLAEVIFGYERALRAEIPG